MQAEPEIVQLIRDLQIQVAAATHSRQREWYTVEQFAALVGREPFTIRQNCNEGRLKATKKGRGAAKNRPWAISHDELLRYEREGLLPIQRRIG